MAVAQNLWILEAQTHLVKSLDFPKVKENLNIACQDKLLVYKGRLESPDLESNARYPIIFPKDHKFTELVVLMCHCKLVTQR